MIRRLIAGGRLLRTIAAAAVIASVAASVVEAGDDGIRGIREQPAAQTASPAPTAERLQQPIVAIAGAVATPAPTPAATATPEPPAPPPSPPASPDPVATATTAATPPPAQARTAVVSPACEPYPVVLSPDPALLAATEAAAAMWNDYSGCDQFAIGEGGLAVAYPPGWPGDCLDPDTVACTTTSISIHPGTSYDLASVLAHELGHVINFDHDSGIPIMDPGNWAGPDTLWCSLFARCR